MEGSTGREVVVKDLPSLPLEQAYQRVSQLWENRSQLETKSDEELASLLANLKEADEHLTMKAVELMRASLHIYFIECYICSILSARRGGPGLKLAARHLGKSHSQAATMSGTYQRVLCLMNRVYLVPPSYYQIAYESCQAHHVDVNEALAWAEGLLRQGDPEPSRRPLLTASKFRKAVALGELTLPIRAASPREHTYGDPLDFRGLRHEPVNENGVIFLFGLVAKDLGFDVESIRTGFPDCEAKRMIDKGKWSRVRIEFEYESRSFRDHGHDAFECDLIVCWRHNWSHCPVEVLELRQVIKGLPDGAKTQHLDRG